MQPLRPHGQRRPSIFTTTWPISPAPPRPSQGLPSRTIPPPTPVPHITPSSDWYRLPAPSSNSASVATCTSLPSVAVVPSSWLSAAPSAKLPSQSGRFRAVDTVPVASSTTPGEPTPTPCSFEGSTPAFSHASRIAATNSAATASGPPLDGVGCREEPSTLWSASTTIASILVPPRSIPPRSSITGIFSCPRLSVVALLGRRLVDRHPEGRELERRDLPVDRLRHRLDAGGQLRSPTHQVLHAQRLERERDVHNG